MVPSVRHFENLTLWIQLRLGLRDRAWKATNEHSRNLAQLSMTVFSKFWSLDRYPLSIHGSRPRCFTCIVEQVTSEVVDMFSRGGRPLACHFVNVSVEMTKFVQRWYFLNPWIQTALFLIIVITATSAAVIWQFAGWISPIPLRQIISISTDLSHHCQQSMVSTMRTNILAGINSWCQLWILTVWGRIYPIKLRFPNIAHDPRCLKTNQNTSIANPAAITRWPL